MRRFWVCSWMGAVTTKAMPWLEAWNLQLLLPTPYSREGLEMGLIIMCTWRNQHKIPIIWGLGRFQVGEYTHEPGRWLTPTHQGQKFLCSIPIPDLAIFGCSPLSFIISFQFSSVQFSCSVVSDSLRPHESQHARPPCPSPTPRVHSNSCPSSRWCHPAISSSVVPFSSCPQSLPASETFPMSQLFTWNGQSIGVSALASVLPMNTQVVGRRPKPVRLVLIWGS